MASDLNGCDVSKKPFSLGWLIKADTFSLCLPYSFPSWHLQLDNAWSQAKVLLMSLLMSLAFAEAEWT